MCVIHTDVRTSKEEKRALARLEVVIADVDNDHFEKAASEVGTSMSEVVRGLVMQWTKQQELSNYKLEGWFVVCLDGGLYLRVSDRAKDKGSLISQIVVEHLQEWVGQD